MKEGIKIFLISIIIIVAIIIIAILSNVIRNNCILQKLYESSKNIKDSVKNYYYEKTSELLEGETRTTTYKIYNYDNKYLIKEYYNDEGVVTTEWVDKNIPEQISIDERSKEESQEIKMKEFDKEYEEALFASTIEDIGYSNVLTSNIFKPISVENNCYVIHVKDTTMYVNMNTGIISKVFYGDGNITCTYKLKNNAVTESEVIKPK